MSYSDSRRLARASLLAIVGLLAVVCDAKAADQAAAVATDRPARPRVGLVLAGGGAKGGAHVGVLKVLEELHVPIDCVAGTSMGALVGAGYASGMQARDIEEFVSGIDWKAVVGRVGQRELEPIEQKLLDNTAGTSLELAMKNGRLIGPPGLIDARNIEDLLRGYVAQARMVPDFNRLPIPFRAVATDMITGSMVVLDHGDIATAMRASMAIPGAFAPVVIEPYVLADGGMVRNIPVDVARQLCADVVIVVNLVEPVMNRNKLVSVPQLLSRSMDVMIQANEDLQLQSLTGRDVRIDVEMGGIGTADFEETPAAIPLGETAARAVASQLAPYAVSEQEYAAWRKRVTTRQQIKTTVSAVEFTGLNRVNPDYLRTLTKVQAGDTVDTKSISSDALRMAVLDDLASVEYRLEGDPSNPVLIWAPEERKTGPDYLWPSLGMYAGGRGDLNFILSALHVRRWLNDRGGQWRNLLELGSESQLATSLYQPFNVAQTYFFEPKLGARRSLEDVYNDGDRVATYQFVDYGAQIDVGANFSKSSQTRIGYWADDRRVTVNTGIELLPESHVTDAGLAASMSIDSRDASTFATRGIAARVEYLWSDSALGADRDWQRIEAGLRTVVPIGRHVMWATVAAGADIGSNTLPPDRAFSLGGPQSFPGYAQDELRARRYWTISGSFLWRLTDLVAVRNEALYAGVQLEAGRVFDRVDPVPDGDVYGLSTYLGGRTPVGTLTLGGGVSRDSWSVWISLGRPIGRGSILEDGLFR